MRSPAQNKPSILVVEDHEDSRVMMQTLLELGGFRVFTASTGSEAVEKAIKFDPNIILMDVNLPGIDGIAATKLIRLNARPRPTPIIALTACDLDETRSRALAAGCNELILKPVDFERLEATLVRLLGVSDPVENKNTAARGSNDLGHRRARKPLNPIRRTGHH